MVSFCCAIESAAKSIVAKDCPPIIFNLKGKGALSHDALRDIWSPDLNETDLTRLLLNHYVLSFEDTLDWASKVQSSLDYPVDPKILSAARNQAVHSLVLDEGRQVDLVAVTAIYMLDFLESQMGEQLNQRLETKDKERLQTFQEERKKFAESAHNKLHEIRSSRLRCVDPLKYDCGRDTDKFVYVGCPLCGTRARIVQDNSRNWLDPGTIFLLDSDSARLNFIYPKHFSCPGCELSLADREVSESGLSFNPLPPVGASWETDKTPLDEEEFLELYEAESQHQSH